MIRPHRCGLSTVVTVLVVGALLTQSFSVPVRAQEHSITVTQGDQTIPVTPLGEGNQSVESFYDYRAPSSEPSGQYSSYGTDELQRDQVSQLFLYRGESGLSLVFLHDQRGGDGGAVITADIEGLPEDGAWAVEDDTYTHRDDSFVHDDRSSHIEWFMNGGRTDGAVFRGLDGGGEKTITVTMRFNDRTDNYPFDEWSGPPEDNEIESWMVRSGSGETTELAMDEPVHIHVTENPPPAPADTPTDTPPNTTSDSSADTLRCPPPQMVSVEPAGTLTATPTAIASATTLPRLNTPITATVHTLLPAPARTDHSNRANPALLSNAGVLITIFGILVGGVLRMNNS
ncbi:cell surface glycoprotein related protein [Halocatena halophila]|uniref:cell surface glycoprotein related protein n=1 Tax=Halocatena halophila TaxID=2814576 RepID=UPI002ED2F9D9